MTNTRAHIHVPANIGEQVADSVVSFIGGWSFIIGQAAIMAVWVVLNTFALFHFMQFDSYPFVFLNLAMSAEAAFASPLILMSQNRQAARDRNRDDVEASEVTALCDTHQLLLTINKQQLEILEQLSEKGRKEMR